jgi:uncharacterized protein with HEPN domain
MARRSREAYLWDITDSCEAIIEFVHGKDLSDYEQDRMLRRAVERELSIVGEAVGQATRHFPDLTASLGPVRQIVGFRNRIVHEYAEINPDIVWAIVQNEVPRLLERSAALLRGSDQGG